MAKRKNTSAVAGDEKRLCLSAPQEDRQPPPQATPPGSPRPSAPAPRQMTYSIAYGNPPPWMR